MVMSKTQVALVLALISEMDGRTFTPATVEAWHSVIGRVDVEDARRAVLDFYTLNARRILPGDIVRSAQAVAEERQLRLGRDLTRDELRRRQNERADFLQRHTHEVGGHLVYAPPSNAVAIGGTR